MSGAGPEPFPDGYTGADQAGRAYPAPPRPGPAHAGQRMWLLVAAVVLAAAGAGTAIGMGLARGDNPGDGATHGAGTDVTPSTSEGSDAETTDPTNTSPSKTTGRGTALSAVHEVTPAKARADLAGAAVSVAGATETSWEWDDSNGHNLLLLSREQKKARGEQLAVLHVVHLAGLGEKPFVLRRMNDDGGGACELDYANEFTPGSVQVSDRDADGVAEVTIGWHHACRGDVSAYDVKLAMLTGGHKFILRGSGLLAGEPDADDVKPASFVPDPAAGKWVPEGSYDDTVKLFSTLYK